MSETNAEVLRQSLAAAAEGRLGCADVWDPLLGDACTAGGAAVVAGARLLSEKAEALRALRIARTAASWRAIFPGCVRVQALAAASRQVSRCDANCQRAQAMAKAEYDALRSFTVKNGELDPATLGDLRGACAAAGCPVCP